jgi:hypothetical protein
MRTFISFPKVENKDGAGGAQSPLKEGVRG